eukprot:scaffold1944_cov241-Pinguiococcus_pyrenoidosus.AAC.23
MWYEPEKAGGSQSGARRTASPASPAASPPETPPRGRQSRPLSSADSASEAFSTTPRCPGRAPPPASHLGCRLARRHRSCARSSGHLSSFAPTTASAETPPWAA